MDYKSLKDAIKAVIKKNGAQEITGQIMQDTLLSIVSKLGGNKTFAGVASPTTVPDTTDANIFYIAGENGTYANFGGAEVENEAVVFVQVGGGTWRAIYTGIQTSYGVDKRLQEEHEQFDIALDRIQNDLTQFKQTEFTDVKEDTDKNKSDIKNINGEIATLNEATNTAGEELVRIEGKVDANLKDAVVVFVPSTNTGVYKGADILSFTNDTPTSTVTAYMSQYWDKLVKLASGKISGSVYAESNNANCTGGSCIGGTKFGYLKIEIEDYQKGGLGGEVLVLSFDYADTNSEISISKNGSNFILARNDYMSRGVVDRNINKLKKGEIDVELTAENIPFMFGHIGVGGTIDENKNKNAVFAYTVDALKGSSFFAEKGYKYEYALYDINTGAFIERVLWKKGELVTMLDKDYKIRIEISDEAENVLENLDIASKLHYNIITKKKGLANFVCSSLDNFDVLLGKTYDLAKTERLSGLIAGGVWSGVGSPNYQHILLRVKKNEKYEIETNENEGTSYAFLTSYNPDNGKVPNITGGATNVNIPKGSKVVVEATAGAKFIYILTKVENTDRTPKSFRIIPPYEIKDANIQHIENSYDDYFQITQQANNITAIVGERAIHGKILTVAPPDLYSCWPFVGNIKDRLVCLYVRALEHEDTNKGQIFSRVSSNALMWTPKKISIDNTNLRDGITGCGNDSMGNLLIFDRVGYPSADSTYVDVYRTSDGFKYDKVASRIFGQGHISNIFSVPTVGLMAIYNKYGSNMSWGIITSSDDGLSWVAKDVETDLDPTTCPCESSAIYIGDGKILVLGRYEGFTGKKNIWQMQSDDYGKTWKKMATNISIGPMNTPSMLFDDVSKNVSAFIFQRGVGDIYKYVVNIDEVWDNPTAWPTGVVVATDVNSGADGGNIQSISYDGKQILFYYSGKNGISGIYCIIV